MSIKKIKPSLREKTPLLCLNFFSHVALISQNTSSVTMLGCEIDLLRFLKECLDTATMSGNVQQVSSYTRDSELVLTAY